MSNIKGTFDTDIVIIGAGPVGLFTVFEAGMLGMSTIVIDSLEEIGGQCAALYPEKPIYDIPAYPEVKAIDLIKSLEKQAAPFKPTYLLSQRVEQIEKTADLWQLVTSQGNSIKAKVIIIAAGVGAFGPNKPPIDNIEEFEGKSIFYHVTDPKRFADKSVVIAGGGDSAVDWCLALSGIAKKVYVVHRRDKFKAAPKSVEIMKQLAQEGNVVELITPYQLADIKGQKGELQEVIVQTLDGQRLELQADVLLPFFGLSMNLGPIAKWGLNLKNKHLEVDISTMQTSDSSIFAVGDIVNYPGKLKLILTGFSEAAIACHNAYKVINPDKHLHFEYSTTKGIPQK